MGRTIQMRGAIGAAVLSGALMWAAAPALGAGWLAWFALVPAAVVALAAPGRAGRIAVPLAFAVYLELLLVPSLPFGLTAGQWGDPALPVMIGDSPVIVVALVAVPLVGLVLYGLRFGRPPRVPDLPGWAAAGLAIVGPAVAWTALDFARAKADPGGLWGPLYLDSSAGVAGEVMALAGPWALTFAIVAVNYAIALAIVRRRPVAAATPATIAAGAMAAIAIALAAGIALAVGVPLGAGPAAGAAGDRSLTVAAIQPGYDTAEEDREVLRFFSPGTYDRASLDLIADLGELTSRAASRGAAVVVWPEAAIWVDPRRVPSVRRALARLAADSAATLVVPYFDPQRDRGATVAVVPRGDGRASLTAARPKQRPMWFLGESADEAPAQPLPAGGVELGTMLGVDTQDPRVASTLSARGARLLSSSTHDWRQLAPFHSAAASASARGAGLPLVRADWRYGSAVYSSSGERLASAGGDLRRTVIVATVGLGAPTAYAALGDVVGWAALGAVAVLWLSRAVWPAAGGRGRRRGSPRPRPAP